MKLSEIKKAVDQGKVVHWSNNLYTVTKDCLGRYNIVCEANGHCIGLTHRDGVTLNGFESEFFLSDLMYMDLTHSEKMELEILKNKIFKGDMFVELDNSSPEQKRYDYLVRRKQKYLSSLQR